MGSFVLEVVGIVYFIKIFSPSKYLGDWTSVGGFRDIWILIEKNIFRYVRIFSKFFLFRFDRGLFYMDRVGTIVQSCSDVIDSTISKSIL